MPYEHARNDLLPDFCRVKNLMVLIVLVQLIALVLVLVHQKLPKFAWDELGLISMYAQWLALLSAAILCQLRPLFARLSLRRAATASYLMVLLLTFCLSCVTQLILQRMGLGMFDAWAVLRDLIISAVLSGVGFRYLYLQAKLRQRESAVANAKIEALQARIRPHFLFNSLNAIASLIAIDADKAEQAVIDMSALYRATLSEKRDFNTWEQELDLCRRYIAVEQLRLGERLILDWQVDEVPKDSLLPPLSLQPLLENAIYHGIQLMPQGGKISISASLKQADTAQAHLAIMIANPLPDKTHAQHDGQRLAVNNIQQRLQALLGDNASLSAAIQGGEYRVLMSMPLKRLADQSGGVS